MNESNYPYRYELKYICSQAQWALVQARIQHLMQLDQHACQKGQYTIRSLYFDDIENSCFFENEDGVDQRAKFRIRFYDQKVDITHLELKEKTHGKTLKRSCPLSKQQCQQLMKGIPLEVSASDPYILQRLSLLMRTQLMRPKVIVEYERIPYVYPLGNVRVTFDRNIRSSNDITGFLDKDIPKRPIMEAGRHVLEVKYDQFLPDFIAQQIQFEKMQMTSFSKYYLCMKYNLGGWER